MPRGDVDKAKRLVALAGLGLSAGLLASLLTTAPAHAGSKIEGGGLTNHTKQKYTLAVGAQKGTATQGSIRVEGRKLKNATVMNDAEIDFERR